MYRYSVSGYDRPPIHYTGTAPSIRAFFVQHEHHAGDHGGSGDGMMLRVEGGWRRCSGHGPVRSWMRAATRRKNLARPFAVHCVQCTGARHHAAVLVVERGAVRFRRLWCTLYAYAIVSSHAAALDRSVRRAAVLLIIVRVEGSAWGRRWIVSRSVRRFGLIRPVAFGSIWRRQKRSTDHDHSSQSV